MHANSTLSHECVFGLSDIRRVFPCIIMVQPATARERITDLIAKIDIPSLRRRIRSFGSVPSPQAVIVFIAGQTTRSRQIQLRKVAMPTSSGE